MFVGQGHQLLEVILETWSYLTKYVPHRDNNHVIFSRWEGFISP